MEVLGCIAGGSKAEDVEGTAEGVTSCVASACTCAVEDVDAEAPGTHIDVSMFCMEATILAVLNSIASGLSLTNFELYCCGFVTNPRIALSCAMKTNSADDSYIQRLRDSSRSGLAKHHRMT